MGLENLKSVFTEGAGNNNSQTQGRFDIFNTINPMTDYLGAVDFQNMQFGGFTHPVTNVPEGFTLNFNDKGVGVGNSKFVNFIPEAAPPKYYEEGVISIENGSSFIGGPKPSIKYNQSIEIPVTIDKNRTFDKSVSIENKAINELYDTSGWKSLYNSDHTSKGLGYNYSANVNQSNLSIQYTNSSGIENPGFSRNHRDSIHGKEPYIISDIGNDDTRNSARSWPGSRSLKDLDRLSRFYLSPKGLQMVIAENLKGLFVRESKPITIGSVELPNPLGPIPQRFNPFFTGPLSTLPASTRLLGYAQPNALVRKDFPLDLIPQSTYTKFLDGTGAQSPISNNEKMIKSGKEVNSTTNVRTSMEKNGNRLGDFMTLGSITPKKYNVKTEETTVENGVLNTKKATTTLFKHFIETEPEFESEANGMPFYFKDLRDGSYLIFRGYISGLTENISPNWNPQSYIGRSEDVYIYQNTSRTLNFQLDLFAGSSVELDMIYEKLNRLTSLCYPEYAEDNYFITEQNNISGKIRMKPPLTKFRMGELFGKEKKEITGFIKSIAYSYPDNSPWETEQGRRVPKLITATISYQVIHNKVPELGTRFYGIEGAK